MGRTYRTFEEIQFEKLADRHEAMAYLDLAIEEYEDDGDAEAFLLALRRVADAQGGIGRLAEATGLNRQHLYEALSEAGNPRLDTLSRVLRGLGFRLRIDLRPAAMP